VKLKIIAVKISGAGRMVLTLKGETAQEIYEKAFKELGDKYAIIGSENA